MADVIIYTDGGSRNNPGKAGIGAVIYHNGEKKAEISEFLGIQTNNWAEYEGAFRALTKAKELYLEHLPTEVRMDSKLVVEQISRNWKIKEPTLKPQAEKIWKLMEHFPNIRFAYIPREQNGEADALANMAMDRGA
ncbi:MAG: ribonuclease HI family protein [Parcubacteria group bacterium]|nr:ribonuclease HI family protein [Parcubacteria group bacterium]